MENGGFGVHRKNMGGPSAGLGGTGKDIWSRDEKIQNFYTAILKNKDLHRKCKNHDSFTIAKNTSRPEFLPQPLGSVHQRHHQQWTNLFRSGLSAKFGDGGENKAQ